MKRIYIAGPLRAKEVVDYIKNVSKMMEEAELVRKAGYAVYVPCTDLLSAIKFGDYEFEDLFNNSFEWLKAADGILMTGEWGNSEGCMREAALAEQLNIPIFYSLPEIIDHFELSESEPKPPCDGECETCLSCNPVVEPTFPEKITIKTQGILGLDEGDTMEFNEKNQTYEYKHKVKTADGYSETRSATISANLFLKNREHFN